MHDPAARPPGGQRLGVGRGDHHVLGAAHGEDRHGAPVGPPGPVGAVGAARARPAWPPPGRRAPRGRPGPVPGPRRRRTAGRSPGPGSGGKSSERRRDACSRGVPDRSVSRAQTSGAAGTAAGPPGSVASRTRASTRRGDRTASCCATKPPMDQPTTGTRSIPSVSSTASTSAAMASTVTGRRVTQLGVTESPVVRADHLEGPGQRGHQGRVPVGHGGGVAVDQYQRGAAAVGQPGQALSGGPGGGVSAVRHHAGTVAPGRPAGQHHRRRGRRTVVHTPVDPPPVPGRPPALLRRSDARSRWRSGGRGRRRARPSSRQPGGPCGRPVGVGQAGGHGPVLVRGQQDVVERQPRHRDRTAPPTRDVDDRGTGNRPPHGWTDTSSRKVGLSGPTASVTLSAASAPRHTEPGQIIDVDAADPVVPPPPDREQRQVAEEPGDVVDEHAVAAEEDGRTDDGIGDVGLGQRPLYQSLAPEVGVRRARCSGLVMLTWTIRSDPGPPGGEEQASGSWPPRGRGRPGDGRSAPSRCCTGWWPPGGTRPARADRRSPAGGLRCPDGHRPLGMPGQVRTVRPPATRARRSPRRSS